LAWIIIGLVCLYMASIFAELTSMFPKAGGVYEFCKQAYSPFWAFMGGWTTFVTGILTMSMLVVGAIQFLAPTTPLYFKIFIALIFIWIFHLIAYSGMETSTTMLLAFASITLIALLAIIIGGLSNFSLATIPLETLYILPLLTAGFFIAQTFFGWETTTFLAEETKDGHKVVPKVLLLSTLIIIGIGLLLTLVCIHI